MKRMVASALVLSILSSSAAICYGMGDEICDLDDFSSFVTGDIPEEVLKGEEKFDKAVEEQKHLDEQTKAEKIRELSDLYGKTVHEAEDLDDQELSKFVEERWDAQEQQEQFINMFDEAKAEEERIAREKAEEEERKHKETAKNVCIGAGVTLAVAAVIAAIVTPCVIYKDQIKKFFCEDVKDFFCNDVKNFFDGISNKVNKDISKLINVFLRTKKAR